MQELKGHPPEFELEPVAEVEVLEPVAEVVELVVAELAVQAAHAAIHFCRLAGNATSDC